MLRIALGVIAGFLGWMIAWIGVEKTLSAILPDWYGAPQAAFQSAIEKGGEFTAETRLLVSHIIIGSVISILAGYIGSLVAGENSTAPLVVGCLLLALGIAKAVMSWPYVPVWYHVIFTAMLLPLAILGGRLHTIS